MGQGQRTAGWAALAVGGVLMLIGIFWGHAGYYQSQALILFLLVAGGAGLAFLGTRLLRKPKQAVEAVDWRRGSEEDER